MNTIIVKADNKLTKALIAIYNALNLSYEIKKGENEDANNKVNSPYDPDFVKMILQAKNSKGRRVLDDDYKKELFGEL
jgi:hypothetical protein